MLRWLTLFFPIVTLAEPIPMSPVEIAGDFGSFTPTLTTQSLEPNLKLVTVKLASKEAAKPPRFTVKWSHPSIDVHAHWSSKTKTTRGNYYNSRLNTRISSGSPVMSFYNYEDKNRFTYAVSDSLNSNKLTTYLREEDAIFYCSAEFFTQPSKALTDYTVHLLIDTREIRYDRALANVAQWWADIYPPASVPEPARQPMYSTWYNFHQSIDPELLLEELRVAKSIGFEAVIIDDGWQTNDAARGYKYTGDWKPERLKNMSELVSKIHAEGMKVLLWYSLPFVGTGAENYDRFKGKYLRTFGSSKDTWVLDPRYPEVREFIIGTYETAMKEWNLDGFKLDFIGWFTATSSTKLTAEEGRDIASVNEAVQTLMTEVMTRLRDVNPEVMIEFRQPYTGPVMKTYGNMLRAIDCPNDAIANRTQIADLRLLSGTSAVHSDMLMWHPKEPVQHAARQILATLYSVPQISVLLTKYEPQHLALVTHWMNYWKENREVFLDGEFTAHHPAANFPVLEARKDGKIIVTCYQSQVINLPKDVHEVHLINATGKAELPVSIPLAASWKMSSFDVLGKLLSEEVVKMNSGFHALTVPPSGMVKLVR